jgi:hypothetical protein
MTIKTIQELRDDMPVGVAGGCSAQDIQNLIDTLEEMTTQRVSAKTATYPAVVGDNRTFFTFTVASGHTFTVPAAAPAGWECAIMQMGVGQTQVLVGTGALRHPDSHTRTGKQYAVIYIKVLANAGTSPQVSLTGETAL